MELIYLDHNSTTPMLPEVVEAMAPYQASVYGNPASAHAAGRKARQALETAREQVAACLGADPAEVLFTSGATEANNLALFGLARQPPGQVIISAVEHPSVSEPVAELRRRGFKVDVLPVNGAGVACVEALSALLGPATRLATVMLANNETGAIQPVAALTQECKGRDVAFHCDAAQAAGKIPVSFHTLGATSLSVSAHKFHGPKGIGALLIRTSARVRPTLFGGHQQRGLRPGTEPVALAVGLAKALELAYRDMQQRTRQVAKLRERFLTGLCRDTNRIVLNSPAEDSLPYTLNISFPGCQADLLLMKLDLAGVACSTGSACSSGSLLPSPVLRAMNCPPEVFHSAMRFSLCHLNTEHEIDLAVERISAAVAALRDTAEVSPGTSWPSFT